MKKSPKLAIVESLDSMDQVQMEEVLSYIRGLLSKPAPEKFNRQRAMKEIRHALHQPGVI
ncbi:MAG: hypothetical protein K1X47_04630 [Cyclobacteriaceae bacterium]|nr:hypothetical protein [Cyclobacteriaceae bacterium]